MLFWLATATYVLFSLMAGMQLINPAKSKIGKISKHTIEKINSLLLEKLEYQQWKNTNAVIKLSKDINNKDNFKYIQVDIKDFYPSITEETLDAGTVFAKMNTNISNDAIQTIKHSKSLCYSTIPKHGKRNQNLALMLLWGVMMVQKCVSL